MREYWEVHDSARARVDPDADPDGLDNVCYPGLPIWLNEYYAGSQWRAFSRLFDLVPPPQPDARALDVGCGTARWSRFLADRGYQVTGIDLQEALVEANRERFPAIDFRCMPLQEYRTDRPFDVATSVTVLQHAPFDEQEVMVSELRELLRPGGHAVVLENVADQEPHVFSRSASGWTELFEQRGFRLRATQRYDYSPATRLLAFLKGRLAPGAAGAPSGHSNPKKYETGERPATNWATATPLQRAQLAALRLAAALDQPLEAGLVRFQAPVRTVHCGFLFEAD